MNLLALIDQAVAEGLAAHKGYLTPYGQEDGRAHKMIVRKVAKAMRESLSVPKDDEGETVTAAPKEPEQQVDHWQCEVWSREWWALFFAQIERGKSVRFMLDVATKSEKGAAFITTFDQQPSTELIEQMQSYPSDGEAAIKWRNWLNRKGIRLPEWRGKMWLFLPSAEPPKAESTAA